MIRNTNMKLVSTIFGVFIAIIFLAFVLFDVAIQYGFMPSTDTLKEKDISSRYIEILTENNIVNSGEKVLFFYSNGLWSILEDGNLYTKERVISYETIDGRLDIYEAKYSEIKNVELIESKEFWGISEIIITKKDDSWFTLYVDNEKNLDKQFVDGLISLWRGENA